ncbi:MAG: DUF5696 domain-containing protein [Firmicutes bacterium]|nr:DUF5696 domain-containing protein [[Eubacterium] siraeum]MCM1487506.1 DUF5696 domain-containing protein [Bacillota bacterium]
MLKFKRKLLAAILAFTIVLSSGVVWSEGVTDETASEPETNESAEAQAGEGGDSDAVPLTEDEALSQMTEVTKNGNLTLYFNEEKFIFAVKNNKSGTVWWSAPYDFETDPSGRGDVMASTLLYNHLDVESNTAPSQTTSSYGGSVKKNQAKVKINDNGVTISYIFPAHGIKIPVYITLEEDRLLLGIKTGDINERMDENLREYKLTTLSLAPSFGAGRSDEDGYLFVPDGSGAIINFNNGKTSTFPYKGKVYGEDLAISKSTAPSKTEQVYLPVLGIMKEGEAQNDAMIAVVTKGDTFANVNAAVSGQRDYNNPVNSAWFSFDFRATDNYVIGTKNSLTVFQSGESRTDDIEIAYYFMSDKDLSLSDMVDTYRNYLIEEKGLKKQNMDIADSLYVTTMGGTVKKQSVLGFPVNMQTVATSYDQAGEMIQTLSDLGVDGMQLTYNDCTESGIRGRVTTAMDYSGKLGGKNKYEELEALCGKLNTELYPSFDFMEYSESGNGYSYTLNCSKRMTNAYATQTAFERSFGLPETDIKPTWTILSPYYIPDVFDKLTKSLTDEGITEISLNQATRTLYSDFSRKNFDGYSNFLRYDTEKILIDGYKKLNDAGISLIAQQCNAYALPYVKAITGIPLYSSNYDLFDYDVPFYQMVIHGYIPYASKPINASSDANELRLLSLATGSAIHYELMYSSPNDLTDSLYEDYFYAGHEGWLEVAAKDYAMFKEINSAIKEQTVIGFEHTSGRSFKITYSDNTTIEIDTDAETFKINGQEKSLADYELKGVTG